MRGRLGFTCPVCDSPMPYPAVDWEICGVCMNEFGYDDEVKTIEELRAEWQAGVRNAAFHRKEVKR